MWEHVESRKHEPVKVFPFGANASEVMLHGTVLYGLKSGLSQRADWAALAHLGEDSGVVRLAFYRVYLVSLSLPLWVMVKGPSLTLRRILAHQSRIDP